MLRHLQIRTSLGQQRVADVRPKPRVVAIDTWMVMEPKNGVGSPGSRHDGFARGRM